MILDEVELSCMSMHVFYHHIVCISVYIAGESKIDHLLNSKELLHFDSMSRKKLV